MKQVLNNIVVCFLVSMFVACSSNGDKKIDELQAKVDSLMKSNQEKDKDMKDMTSFVNVISTSLDSIRAYEDSVLLGSANSESPKVTKEQVKQKLEKMKELIGRQQLQLSQLRKQLESANGKNSENMRKMAEFYEAQLKEKEAQIASLRAELDKKNVDISRLRTNISSLTTSNKQLEEKAEAQNTALSIQNEILNTGYVQIGTKKELTSKGLLTGGFLKKKTVDTSKLKESNFNKVDIRQFTEVKLQSKSPKILTQMPAGSYSMTKNSDGTTTLQITDPASFWSVSNFLIIQL